MITKSEKRKKTPNLQHWLKQKLRRASYAWPPRKEAIKQGRVSRGKYKCSSCGGENFGPKDIELDHTIPCIDPHEGFRDWNTYIERLFCAAEGFTIMCKPCHAIKTFRENLVRSAVKKENESDDEI